MANWVCRADGTVFTVGAAKCPSPGCGARDAFEQGGDEQVNVYDPPEWQLPPIEDDPVAQRLGLVPTPAEGETPASATGRRTSKNVQS